MSEKLQQLTSFSPGRPILTKDVREMGISPVLAHQYSQNGWLESLGRGVWKLPHSPLSWASALQTIQQGMNLKIHLGGRFALESRGLAHYLRQGKRDIRLFSPIGVALPAWFVRLSWEENFSLTSTAFLPEDAGVSLYEIDKVVLAVSSPERAILECLYGVPQDQDMVEGYHLLEGLRSLRPSLVQSLLEKCSSVKVKRLFLFMARKAKLPCLEYLDLTKITLGTGDRTIVKGGIFDKTYGITVSPELIS